MATWKLSINPDEEKGFAAFDYCQSESLVGIGWSYIYEEEEELSAKDEIFAALEAYEKSKKVPYQVRCFFDEVKQGDYIWIHKHGLYFLCTILDDEVLAGPQITSDFLKYDLGHARKASWVEVPHIFVPGWVQRGVIARRTIQRIYCPDQAEGYFEYLSENLSNNAEWIPAIKEIQIQEYFDNTAQALIEGLLTPDDYEDLVAAYLQSQGWTLLKSTCFRSKPMFEFLMVKSGPKYGHVQIKSGEVQLPPADYAKWVKDDEEIYLFSSHSDAYPGPSVEGVITIRKSDLLVWARKHSWALSPEVRVRIQIAINSGT